MDFIWFIFLMGLLWCAAICLIMLTTIPLSIILTTKASYCPDCRRYFRLKHSSTILIQPSFQSKGRERFTCHCSRCAYHREREAVIPKLIMENARCPSCYKLSTSNLGQAERTLVEPTYTSEGIKPVVRHCSHCSHRWEYEEAISKLYCFDAP
jgi:hypothetical protein